MKPTSSRRYSSGSSRRNSCAKSAAILSTAGLSLGICAASLAPLADCSPASALAKDASRCRGVLMSQQRQQRALRAAQSAARTETLSGFENRAYEQRRQQTQQVSTSDASDGAHAPAAQEGGLDAAHYEYPWCDSESDPECCYSAGSSSGYGGDEYDPEESDPDSSHSHSGSDSGSDGDSGGDSGGTGARSDHALGLGGARAAKNFADFGCSYRHHPFYPGSCSGSGSGGGSSGSGNSGTHQYQQHRHFQHQHQHQLHEDEHEHEHQHQLEHRHHHHQQQQQSRHPLQHHHQNQHHHQQHHHHHQQQQQHQLRSASSLPSSSSSSSSSSHFFPPFPAGVSAIARATAAAGLALAVLAPLFRALSSHWAYFVAGGVCAAVSHTAAVPLDVLKTRIQCAPPGEYRGTLDALVRICRSEGTQALFCGAGATLVGYAMQGSLKFGFFEFLKPLFARLFSGHGGGGGGGGAISGVASSPVLGSLVAASIAAEVVGSSALTPLEAARIRMVADRDFAPGLRSGIARIVSEEGLGALGRGLPAVLAKQIPYTVTKLVTFDVFVRWATKAVRSRGAGVGGNGVAGRGAGGGRQAWVTVGCAVAAGMLSSLASQPGDSLLSTLHSEGRSKKQCGGGGGGNNGRRGIDGRNGCGSSEGESSIDGGEDNFEEYFEESFEENSEEAFEGAFAEAFEERFEARNGFAAAADREPVTHALARIARETGFLGLFRGTGARMLHVTSIVTLQLLIYQSVKRMVGITA